MVYQSTANVLRARLNFKNYFVSMFVAKKVACNSYGMIILTSLFCCILRVISIVVFLLPRPTSISLVFMVTLTIDLVSSLGVSLIKFL